MSSRRTLWEEGRHPGRLVANASGAVAVLVVVIDLLLTHEITLFFDLAFVLLCAGAALAVRPRDFFVIGVFPPLLMAGAVLGLAVFARTSIADVGDGLVQAVVSGLAHHSGALVAGYALTLVVLAIRRATLHRRRASARVAAARPHAGRAGRPVTVRTSPVPAAAPAAPAAVAERDPDWTQWDLPAADRGR